MKSATQLIVFDDIIADVISNKKLSPILTELFIRREKLNISTIFTTQTYFKIPKDVRLNSRHFLLGKLKATKSFNKLHVVIHQISTLKTLWIIIKNILQNHILL